MTNTDWWNGDNGKNIIKYARNVLMIIPSSPEETNKKYADFVDAHIRMINDSRFEGQFGGFYPTMFSVCKIVANDHTKNILSGILHEY